MCVSNLTKIQVLKEDLTAYKVVIADKFNKDLCYSRYHPTGRLVQFRPEKKKGTFYYSSPRGETFTYTIGERITSNFEDTPGLYCYVSKEALIAMEDMLLFGSVAMEVLVPKGTKIRRAKSLGTSDYEDVILTEELIPVKVFAKKCPVKA